MKRTKTITVFLVTALMLGRLPFSGAEAAPLDAALLRALLEKAVQVDGGPEDRGLMLTNLILAAQAAVELGVPETAKAALMKAAQLARQMDPKDRLEERTRILAQIARDLAPLDRAAAAPLIEEADAGIKQIKQKPKQDTIWGFLIPAYAAAGDVDRAFAALSGVKDDYVQDTCSQEIITAVSKTDWGRALELLKKQKDENAREDTRHRMIVDLATRDWDRAMGEVKELPDPYTRGEVIKKMILKVARVDTNRAITLTRDCTKDIPSADFLWTDLALAVARTDVRRATELIQEVKNPVLQAQVQVELCHRVLGLNE